ncbi:hypothetical protein ALC53_02633 [Atta colombica]|uniref:Uncharacterized protein n=1 Tax=Atta colombica TaxID=520822 RepID=A0A195BS86_9HYME|nr:hypothetical protein ALC53_02633 [Atta colombica]
MADNQSNATICCSKSNGNQFLSIRQIIFGWNRFNSISWLLLFVFFCIWCITYFSAYKIESEEDNNHDNHHHH